MELQTFTITRIQKTGYDDGTYWIEYRTNAGHYGYELLEEGQEIVDIIGKPNLSVCSKITQELIENCLESENEMWFVEQDEIDEYIETYEKTQSELIEEIETDINQFELSDYIKFNEDGCIVTVYGGIITKFEF